MNAITWLYIEGCLPKDAKQRFLLKLYGGPDGFECVALHEGIAFVGQTQFYTSIYIATGPTLASVIGKATEACMNYKPETEAAK